MDYMDSGMRYTPKSDKDWDSSVQFLPASDNKKLEKKKGPGKVGAVIGVVIFAAVVALMTGLLVWHFHFRKDVRVKKMYTGSMRISNQAFQEAYENSNSSEFKALAKQVTSQLKGVYTRSPQLAKYYVGSTVQAFSEGSVIAYYLSEFSVPSGQENTVDNAMASLEKLVIKERSIVNRPGNSLVFEDVVSSAIDARLFSASFSGYFRYHHHIRTNQPVQIQSLGFPHRSYPPRTYFEWRLRADPGYIIKLNFDTIDLEENCTNDYIKIYNSLSNIESRAMQRLCGAYPPSEPMTFLSSGNVMLVTMVTNEKDNYIGFRASASQIKRGGKETTCGGRVTGVKGSFTSPNFPNYYPPNSSCKWSIEVPPGKAVKVTFKTFLLAESRQSPSQRRLDCGNNYVMVNGKRLCGEHADGELTETKNTNTMEVEFKCDFSYVDQGFFAEFEAIDITDPCPRQFQCRNQRCIRSMLRCDGWNDCGDMSDELQCKCAGNVVTCGNGLCKPMFWKCDGIDDCGDGTDESKCGGCPSGQIRCQNNKCVSEKKRCDGKNDCGDGTDELNCPTNDVGCTDLTFKCKNNKCISKINPECDGTPDCEDGSDEENCDCGRSMFKTSRIVGGQNADPGEFPWQVSLQDKKGGHVCGASVISTSWLVTAAHCVKVDGQPRYSQPTMWEAYLGLHTQRKIDSNVVRRNVKRIIPHPYYNTYTFDNDIALMELETPVTYSKYIRPICLPSAQHIFPVGQNVWITGWGATREGGFAATVLQKAEVRYINHTVCNELMSGQLTSRMLCAGVLSGGVDACQGDSGGPLSSPSGNCMFLAGVVSWGDGCARRNKPGIYTTVTKFRGWIKQHTGV